jgi:hypothetical protein
MEHLKAAARSFHELLELEGIPAPDQIEYGYACIRLMWRAPRIAVVVEMD